MEKINLEEFILKNIEVRDSVLWSDLEPELKGLLLNFGKQLLQLASENAKTLDMEMHYGGMRAGSYYIVKEIDKESITNTINQVE